jgi:hypothetical protein
MVDPDHSSPSTVPGASTGLPVAGTRTRIWSIAVAAGVAAGLIAWAIGEATLVPEAAYQDKKQHINVLPQVAGIQNCFFSFGALGAAIGLGLGMAGGLAGRSVVRAVMAGGAGLLLGGGCGVALTRLIVPYYYENSRSGDIVYSLLVHGGIWTAAAAVAGLAFAIGLGEWRGLARAILGAAGGAFLAAIMYEIGGGMLFPSALTDRPISTTWASRLFARLTVTVLAAAGVALLAEPAGGERRRPSLEPGGPPQS